MTVRDGEASARWSHQADRRETPPEENPRFVFTAHSAWCPWKKSENTLEVRLKRPEITKAEWRDADGNTASKGLVGEGLRLHAETRDIEDGQGATFTVYDRQTGEEVFQTGAEVRDGIAEAEWTYDFEYNHQNPMKQKPKFSFTVTAQRCKKKESSNVEIGMNHKVAVHDENGEPARNAKFYVSYSDGTRKKYMSNNQGEIELKDFVPGIVLEIAEEKTEETGLTTGERQK